MEDPELLPTLQTFDEHVVLANEQSSLYQDNSDIAALDLAIHHYCAAFELGPMPDTRQDYILSYFRFHHASLLRIQKHGGENLANTYLDKVLESTPPTHFLRPVLLGIKAASYTRRYQQTKDTADLNLAVGLYKTVMDTIPAFHPQRIYLMAQYGSNLYSKFIALKDEDDLNLAIQKFRSVLGVCPADLLLPARRCLVLALDARYRLRYDIGDMDDAVEAYIALFDTPQQEDSQEYLLACMGYAVILWNRFHRRRDVDDLHTAIEYFEIIIRRRTPDHQYYFSALTFYASLLVTRSEQRESIQDIDNAIECVRSGLDIGRADDPSRPELLSMLGYCLVSRFVHCGSTADLESAVENCYAAVCSDWIPDAGACAGIMNRLAFVLFTRYQLQGDTMDANRAKDYLHHALVLCPSPHPQRLFILNNSARTLGSIACRESNLSELDLPFGFFFQALDLAQESARSTILANLALYIHSRYRKVKVGNSFDLETAFAACKAALDLQKESHPKRAWMFLIQAKVVLATFSGKHTTILDTEIALDILHAAKDEFTPEHPLLVETYRELSNVYSLRYSITNSGADLENAFEYGIMAAKYPGGGSQVQLEAAMKWVESAEKFGHPSVLDAYKSAIRNLNFHVILKPTVDLRHDIVRKQTLSICANATSCALRHNDVVSAVEMFEHSRGLFWTHMAQLRTPLDELRASGPNGRELADEFESLSHDLETPMMTGDDGEYGQRFRRTQRDWNATVEKIRRVDGFFRFLLPSSYEDLRVAAIGGPVIILNASPHSCDAIIVLANAEPIHVAFSEVSYLEIKIMSTNLQQVVRTLRGFEIDSNHPEKRSAQGRLIDLLSRLWDSIVSEVVRQLEPHAPKNSRIWWCPTGVFTSLPIHAARPKRKGERGLSDIYISSYTPTLSALIRSRNKRNTQKSAPSFVSIGQPNSIEYDLLASVGKELDLLQKFLPGSIPFTKLIGEMATCEAALKALSAHTYAHLACHGQQVIRQPYESHFAMYDGRLTLLDIVHSQAGHETEFAFLSACKTATGDEKAPDEVVHLAAALQFAGVPSVIGTMWPVDDAVVIHTVEEFYRAMTKDGVFDPSRAARALRAATKATWDRVPLDQRIVFIHIGA